MTDAPIVVAAPDIPAEAAHDFLICKHDDIFVCSGRDGDIDNARGGGDGVYAQDTRFLSRLGVRLGGKLPVVMASSAASGFEAVIDSTNATLEGDVAREGNATVDQMILNIRRTRLVAGRVYETISVTNYAQERVATDLTIALAADFADVFEVRNVHPRSRRGTAFDPDVSQDSIRFRYRGQDAVDVSTHVVAVPTPARVTATPTEGELMWPVELAPGERMTVDLAITPSSAPSSASSAATSALDREHARSAVVEAHRSWRDGCARIATDNPSFDALMDSSYRDLRILMTPLGEGSFISAGVPWYVAPFGRDALITAYEILMIDPEPARQVLLLLAAHQSGVLDPDRDAEPGKILHEIRSGELARAGLIPHRPYYGTVDATPLFLVLAATYHRWTGDDETIDRLMPSLERALGWLERFGDADGDGYVEYEQHGRGGLANHGWKDSHDSIVHADGRPAEGPIALVEVQAYVYMAKLRMAGVYAALGSHDIADRLRKEADDLRIAFNADFWMPEEGTFCLGLDGAKRQIGSVTSNAGHALFAGIVDDDRAGSVVERLMARDMFSGWGIRTLSSSSPAYNPMSYHNGSVWPHDNALAVVGFKRYGYVREVERVAAGIIDSAGLTPERRPPELFCGFYRKPDVPPVWYPVACSPQAWSAAAPFVVLQALLGIASDAPSNALTIHSPHLPEYLTSVRVERLRLSGSSVDLAFNRTGVTTSFSLERRDGDVRVALLG